MIIQLTEQQKAYQAIFRAFVAQEVAPYAHQFDQDEHIPGEFIAKLAQQGYLGATLSKDYSGQAMDLITYGLLNEELGRECASVRGLVMLQNMLGQTIYKWGNASQKEQWLKKIASGKTIAALALTESGAGSDLKQIKTSATLIDNSYVLNGHKQWISFGQIANLFLILARTDGNLSAFLIDRDTPGLSVEPIPGMLGLKGAMLANLRLENCTIPEKNLVGGAGFGLFPVALHALNLGRYSIAWGCVGIAQACLEACVQHVTTRAQAGVFLSEHQLIQQMITEMIANVKAARLLCYQAGHLESVGDPNSVMETMVAKYFASTTATKTAGDAVQIHGAIGCSRDHIVQRHWRDAKIMELIEGTTQIHQINIARFGYQTYANN